MTGFWRGFISWSKESSEIWRLVRAKSQRSFVATKDLSTDTTNAFERTARPSNPLVGAFRKSWPYYLSSGSSTSQFARSRFSHPSGSIPTAFPQRLYSTAPAVSQGPSPGTRALTFVGLLGASAAATYFFYPRAEKSSGGIPEEFHTVSNWSNTHEVKSKVYIQPESLEELEKVVQIANQHKQKIRAVGSGLSPNGIGLCSEGMVNLALMDRVLNVDKDKMQVTVQAGARVEQVVEALKPYGLTLQNYASIKEQQIGGFIQVGAHGTGAKLPPVDEQVVSLKLVTPAKGTLDLSPESDADLFYLSRCGLGALGVVAEVTLQCVPRHRLLEYTFVTDMKGVQRNHKKWLNQNKHLRYMWIPDTDVVVVVQCNNLPEGKDAPKVKTVEADEKLRGVRELFKEVAANHRQQDEAKSTSEQSTTEFHRADERSGAGSGSGVARNHSLSLSDERISELSYTELRDILIALDPLNREHIQKVNRAEAEYWKLSQGYRTGWSDEILGFDCGGQQWVSEVAFPVGTLKKPNMNDIKYMEELLKLIDKEGIPAHTPIEQRWTARSRSPMSPASSSPDTVFSWVGIIMYLPTSEEAERTAITNSFFDYRKSVSKRLWDAYGAYDHWAKIEVLQDEEDLTWMQERLKKRFPTETFNKMRTELDPNHILSNDHIDIIFPL